MMAPTEEHYYADYWNLYDERLRVVTETNNANLRVIEFKKVRL
jgi:hypothetical protein